MARRKSCRTGVRVWREARGLSKMAVSKGTGIPYTEVRRIDAGETDVRWSSVIAWLNWANGNWPHSLAFRDFGGAGAMRRVRHLEEAALFAGET